MSLKAAIITKIAAFFAHSQQDITDLGLWSEGEWQGKCGILQAETDGSILLSKVI
jgi:hypothetical protein